MEKIKVFQLSSLFLARKKTKLWMIMSTHATKKFQRMEALILTQMSQLAHAQLVISHAKLQLSMPPLASLMALTVHLLLLHTSTSSYFPLLSKS